MSLFSRKKIVIEKQEFTIGEFDINVDGAYRNIVTFPIEGKKGRKLTVSVKSDNGVDVSIVDAKGMNEKFRASVKDEELVVPILDNGTMSLIFGVYRGDKSKVTVEAWTE